MQRTRPARLSTCTIAYTHRLRTQNALPRQSSQDQARRSAVQLFYCCRLDWLRALPVPFPPVPFMCPLPAPTNPTSSIAPVARLPAIPPTTEAVLVSPSSLPASEGATSCARPGCGGGWRGGRAAAGRSTPCGRHRGWAQGDVRSTRTPEQSCSATRIDVDDTCRTRMTPPHVGPTAKDTPTPAPHPCRHRTCTYAWKPPKLNP